MATRSTIALEFADGTVQQVYCHWDGYLSFNGELLLKHYRDPFKVRELIDQGDLSALGEEIGEQHPFDNPYQYGTPEYKQWSEFRRKFCTFFSRDRGETDCEARKFKNFNEYVLKGQKEQYDYILRTDGNWYVNCDDEFELLTNSMIKAEA